MPGRPIVLIGAGRMGFALLKGWIGKGAGPLVAVEPSPSPEIRRLARSRKIELRNYVGEIPIRARVCVVALKPQVLKTEAARLRPFAQFATPMISIAAGTRTATLTKAWGERARIVRAMPNLPGSIGRGITALYASPAATKTDRKLAESLLSALGDTFWVARESLIDSVTAVSGSGPAYVFLLAEALADAARAEGLADATAEKLALKTVAGAGALLDVSRAGAADLRREVASRGGTTEAALKVLMGRDGLKPLIARAVRAARKRAKKLGS